MASEDNFLRLDLNNYSTEFEYILNTVGFTAKELVKLFKTGQITAEEYIYGMETLL